MIIIPLATVAWVAIISLGLLCLVLAEQLTEARKKIRRLKFQLDSHEKAKLRCGCGHGETYHDENRGRCHHNTPPTNKTIGGPCGCLRYDGPPPIEWAS